MGITPGDLEAHFIHELERLYKLSGTGNIVGRKRRPDPGRPPALPGDSGPEGRWETFQRIKTNRQGRLRLKIRKRKADDGCPICISHMHKSSDEQCLRKSLCNDEDETVDVEGDSELEDWPEAQKRRNDSLVAGFSAGTTPSSSGRVSIDADVEGEDLVVDGDEPEESSFGPSQYTESDVVSKSNEDKHKDKDGVQSQVATVNSSGDVEIKVESAGQQCDSNVSTSDAEPSSRAQIIEELRNRIRQLEAEGSGETATSTEPEDYKCLICLEHYKKPVISTVCWHVHCEECWLHTLGSKKVCPQCNQFHPDSLLKLMIKWQNILFPIRIEEEDTLSDLKCMIHKATNLKPSLQELINLHLPADVDEENCKLQQLNLKSEFVLKVIDKSNLSKEASLIKLKVEWENIYFQIGVMKENTICDLKYSIGKATGLQPSDQKLINLALPEKEECKLHQLNLNPEFVLKVVDKLNRRNTSFVIKMEWENIYFKVGIREGDTILRLKDYIYAATDLEPFQQNLLNLLIPKNRKEDNCTLQKLNLPANFILKVINKFNKSASNNKQFVNIPKHLYPTKIEKQFIKINRPRQGKKLVVLDIDCTICDYESPILCYAARPFLDVFLKSIYKYFDIGIWSATDMDVVEEKMNVLGLSNNPNYKILFYMNKAAMVYASLEEYRILVKPLKQVWTRLPQYNCQNTIICDDQDVNFIYNPKNGILVKPYYYQDHAVDNELLQLLYYLKLIVKYDDLTILDHKQWKNNILDSDFVYGKNYSGKDYHHGENNDKCCDGVDETN
ncbi:hypothetical protein ILUMI_26543 [Ignelater luminosus]|uniref:Ubiquitin-like domain-containing CTD phosphatase 1 n=1 Tax=Ignelater luminosus TaxID=2038154 RepID=A0A8K0FVW9_IGNLU|nr:hypothetical protein ILUMI_26543 [Ignelater luminosus]